MQKGEIKKWLFWSYLKVAVRKKGMTIKPVKNAFLTS